MPDSVGKEISSSIDVGEEVVVGKGKLLGQKGRYRHEVQPFIAFTGRVVQGSGTETLQWVWVMPIR